MINLYVLRVSRSEWTVGLDSGRNNEKYLRLFTGFLTANLYATEIYNILAAEFGAGAINLTIWGER